MMPYSSLWSSLLQKEQVEMFSGVRSGKTYLISAWHDNWERSSNGVKYGKPKASRNTSPRPLETGYVEINSRLQFSLEQSSFYQNDFLFYTNVELHAFQLQEEVANRLLGQPNLPDIKEPYHEPGM